MGQWPEQHLSEFHVGRISGDGTILVLVTSVIYQSFVPDAEITLARFPMAKNGGRRSVDRKRLPVGKSRKLFCSHDLPDVALIGAVFDVSAQSFEHSLGRGDVASIENLFEWELVLPQGLSLDQRSTKPDERYQGEAYFTLCVFN